MYGITTIILAAGSSNRLGQPKQLLLFRDKPLLRHVTDIVTETALGNVYVVLGANAEKIIPCLEGSSAEILLNPDWKTGMASSIRTGMLRLQKSDPLPEAVMLMVCDQPFVSSAILVELVKKYSATEKKIIACKYADTMGTPVLFSREYFAELTELEGNSGAKKILLSHPDATASIDFPEGRYDIDLPADLQLLEGNNFIE